METRLATPDDIDDLLRLRRRLMAHFGWDRSNDGWIPAARSRLTDGMADGSVVAAVGADADGRAVASGVAEIVPRMPSPAVPDGRVAHVSSMVTEESARGVGHGRRIVRLLVEELRRRGITTIELFAASPDAERLYRSERFDDRPGGRAMRHVSDATKGSAR